MQINKLVSIMVPVYNVEKSISRCALSLLNQTYDNIEYIFVNDYSPDNSIKVLKDIIKLFPDKQNKIKIIEHEKNLGLGAARETGFINSTGDYLIHIDSDDWCDPLMIEDLVNKIEEKNADIVVCNYFINSKNSQIEIKNIDFEDSFDLFTKILRDELVPSLCNKLVKRCCYENIKFPDFNLGEDLYICLQLVHNSKKAVSLNNAYFHYNQENEKSITTNRSSDFISPIKVYTLAIKDLLLEWGYYDQFERDYYTGVLSRVLVLSDGQKIKTLLNTIEPKAFNIYNLWSLKNRSFGKKAVYSLSFIHLGKTVAALKKFNNYIKKFKS